MPLRRTCDLQVGPDLSRSDNSVTLIALFFVLAPNFFGAGKGKAFCLEASNGLFCGVDLGGLADGPRLYFFRVDVYPSVF